MMRVIQLLMAAVLISAGALLADEDSAEIRAIAKIELLGGKVEQDEALPNCPVTGILFEPGCRFNGKHVHLLQSFKHLEEVTIEDGHFEFTDNAVQEFAKLTKLKTLRIYGDPGLKDAHAALLTDVKVCRLAPLSRFGDDFKGRKITGVTDRKDCAWITHEGGARNDGTKIGPAWIFQTRGSFISLGEDQITVNEEPNVEIPAGTKTIKIHDARGTVHIYADGKLLYKFKRDSQPS